MPNRPTMQSIADYVRVNKSTVSRALNTPERVRPETRSRILQAAQRLGYFQFGEEAVVAEQSSDDVGLLVDSRTFASPDRFYTEIIRGCLEEANRWKRHVVVNAMDIESSDTISGLVSEGKVKQLIVIATAPDALQCAIAQRKIAAIGIDLETPSFEFATIYADNSQGTQLLMEHLYGLGHRRAAFAASAYHISFRERHAGYALALAGAGQGYDQDLVFLDEEPNEGDRIYQIGRLAVDKFLALPPHRRPTAIVCGNDPIALQTVKALTDAGLRVPDDISVTGFDNLDWAGKVSPTLTTVNIPKLAIGELALQFVTRMGKPTPASRGIRVSVPVSLVARGSTQPPSEHS